MKLFLFFLIFSIYLYGETLIPFKKNYQDKIYGDVVTIGGILQTPKNHRANNNDETVMYDFDEDLTWGTKNSSRSELIYPHDSFIRIAKLYWWGRGKKSTKGINKIKFKTPVDKTYKDLLSDKTVVKGRRYISMADVTKEVIFGEEGYY
ncbi:MAG: hypothetical protein OIF32_12490, partial [Campylobacterales bacterium]|nr:hypothetical protein [Campylobacterales bacterium]